ncbi:MAG: sigma-54 dependent transcriptional regulator [Desulfofustis sp.]|nr:sigma-54 dependent transcriptional regulator [Desulfofustis sp.]
MKAKTEKHEGKKTILAVDGDAASLEMVTRCLRERRFRVLPVSEAAKALTLAGRTRVDLAVIGEGEDPERAIELVEQLRELQRDLHTIVLAAEGSIDRAIDVVKRGACHYLTKPFAVVDLLRHIESCLELSPLPAVGASATKAAPVAYSCDRIIAHSRVMKEVLAKVAQVAVTDSSVLIEGESGTGKELIARCLHGASRRKDGPFIAINCAAIPENLLESELLGYERGAFTGADGRREGLFARAHGGSFFFDELSELPLPMQAKLLRILEEREFYPLGSNTKVSVDVRIIAASNRRLEQLVEAGRFREDLYYRVRVIPIMLPSLRERKEDILPLARHFLSAFCQSAGKPPTTITPEALQRLQAADWPGNIRDLENVMEYAGALCNGSEITKDLIAVGSPAKTNGFKPLRLARDNFEKHYLTELLQTTNGNVSQAAKAAGVYRADLYVLLRKHGLAAADFRDK